MRVTKFLAAVSGIVIFTLGFSVPAGELELGQQALEQGDYPAAKTYLSRSAKRGSAAAHYALGYMNQAGRGYEQDMKAAVRHYRVAAHRGHAEANFALGSMHEHGLGVHKDIRHASEFYYAAGRLYAARGAVAQLSLCRSALRRLDPEHPALAKLEADWRDRSPRKQAVALDVKSPEANVN